MKRKRASTKNKVEPPSKIRKITSQVPPQTPAPARVNALDVAVAFFEQKPNLIKLSRKQQINIEDINISVQSIARE